MIVGPIFGTTLLTNQPNTTYITLLSSLPQLLTFGFGKPNASQRQSSSPGFFCLIGSMQGTFSDAETN